MEGVAARAAQHAELIVMVVVVAAQLCCSQLRIRRVNYGHQIQKCTPFVFQTQSEALFSRPPNHMAYRIASGRHAYNHR